MPIDDDQIAALDDYSREFAQMCFELHPEWREFAWAEVEVGEEQPCLVIQFPAPDERGFDLELSTYAGEATLSADFWHAHASTLAETADSAPDTDPQLDAAHLIELTERLLKDQRTLWVRFESGEYDSSGLIDSPAAEAALERSLKKTTHLTLRTHSGKKAKALGSGPTPDE